MKTYTIDFWLYEYRHDDYVDYTESVEAKSLEDAFAKIKNKYPSAKNLKQC